jgi:DNA-binding response OmpR family regulator
MLSALVLGLPQVVRELVPLLGMEEHSLEYTAWLMEPTHKVPKLLTTALTTIQPHTFRKMLSLRQNYTLLLASPAHKEEIKICPHCGGNIAHDPNDTFDFTDHIIIAQSRRIEGVSFRRHVPPKTWNVLLYLLKSIGQWRSTERIWTTCFDEDVDSGIVTVQIGLLRKFLQGTNYEIETQYGAGYRLLRKK